MLVKKVDFPIPIDSFLVFPEEVNKSFHTTSFVSLVSLFLMYSSVLPVVNYLLYIILESIYTNFNVFLKCLLW